jgi:hypothetical protein
LIRDYFAALTRDSRIQLHCAGTSLPATAPDGEGESARIRGAMKAQRRPSAEAK